MTWSMIEQNDKVCLLRIHFGTESALSGCTQVHNRIGETLSGWYLYNFIYIYIDIYFIKKIYGTVSNAYIGHLL